MKLTELREKIDVLDGKILRLLRERMELGLMTKRLKPGVEDRKREDAVLARIAKMSTGVIRAAFIEGIYREILGESKTLQRKGYELIAFQGEHGAYSEVASGEWNPELVPVPCAKFADVFEGVESGLYDYGIVPVENTLGGVVGQVNELLIGTPLHVVGAVELPIHHCLLALPDMEYREIRTAFSHPQALAQCRRFLMRNGIKPVTHFDTAGAARMVSEKSIQGAAAIASRLSGTLYNLEIIKEGIEDLDRNLTRFLVLSREENRGHGDKCSIVFFTEHKAGSLFRVLDVFAGLGINLTRIESIPAVEPGTYAFFLDFMGSQEEKRVRDAMEKMKRITRSFRLLGCFRERKIL